MTPVNQAGEPIQEEVLFGAGAVYCSFTGVSHEELERSISLLCAHLNVEIVRTNATKHGTTELELRAEPA